MSIFVNWGDAKRAPGSRMPFLCHFLLLFHFNFFQFTPCPIIVFWTHFCIASYFDIINLFALGTGNQSVCCCFLQCGRHDFGQWFSFDIKCDITPFSTIFFVPCQQNFPFCRRTDFKAFHSFSRHNRQSNFFRGCIICRRPGCLNGNGHFTTAFYLHFSITGNNGNFWFWSGICNCTVTTCYCIQPKHLCRKRLF